jgi:hypothetical protein
MTFADFAMFAGTSLFPQVPQAAGGTQDLEEVEDETDPQN